MGDATSDVAGYLTFTILYLHIDLARFCIYFCNYSAEWLSLKPPSLIYQIGSITKEYTFQVSIIIQCYHRTIRVCFNRILGKLF